MKINIVIKDDGFCLYGCRYWDVAPKTGDWIWLEGPKEGDYLIVSSRWKGNDEPELSLIVSSLEKGDL